MIQRLHNKRIELSDLTGENFLNEFVYVHGPLRYESHLEDGFKNALSSMSGGQIIGYKAHLKKGITDGLFGVFIRENGRKILNFLFNTEVKLSLNRHSYKYKELIKQNLFYGIQDSNIKCLIMLGEDGLDWLYLDENMDIINEYKESMIELLKEYSPSSAARIFAFPITQLKIYTANFPTPANIKEIMKEIIKHCSKL